MISMLCPTRGRVPQAEKLLKSFYETQVNENEILFYIQEDDKDKDNYVEMFKRNNHTGYIIEPFCFTSYMWNRLSDIAKGDLLTLMGDDVIIETKGWDQKFEDISNEYEDKIFCLSCLDGRTEPKEFNVNLSNPHPTVHRRWKEILGYFMPPQFLHRYLDTYTSYLAINLNRYINVYDVRFKHQKSLTNNDETGQKSRQWLIYDKYSNDITKRWFNTDLELLRKNLKV